MIRDVRETWDNHGDDEYVERYMAECDRRLEDLTDDVSAHLLKLDEHLRFAAVALWHGLHEQAEQEIKKARLVLLATRSAVVTLRYRDNPETQVRLLQRLLEVER